MTKLELIESIIKHRPAGAGACTGCVPSAARTGLPSQAGSLSIDTARGRGSVLNVAADRRDGVRTYDGWQLP
jgi:hypothetical protein